MICEKSEVHVFHCETFYSLGRLWGAVSLGVLRMTSMQIGVYISYELRILLVI